MERIEFKYHPNLYSDMILIRGEGVCNCCGKKVTEYIDSVYSPEDLDCISLGCISDGSAAEKFDAEFVQYAEEVSDPEKRDELFHRTPGYMSWQGENWLACCDDYCAYLGPVGMEELEELGIKDEVLEDYASQVPSYPIDVVEEYLSKDGDLTGYLFRCLHCGKYRLYVDAS
ncbi:MAG: CbrC family protein [Oscillospiraceae bacterium]|nr:CbrC family protein [Oscillospiraceae bacterium]